MPHECRATALRNGACGPESVKRTVSSSIASTDFSFLKLSCAYSNTSPGLRAGWFLSFWRMNVNTTASALNGVPSWNVTPSRSWKVQTSLSGLASQPVANHGTSSVLPGANETSVSKMFEQTLTDSPSVTFAGSSLTASAPRPHTKVPPRCGFMSSGADPSSLLMSNFCFGFFLPQEATSSISKSRTMFLMSGPFSQIWIGGACR